MAVDEHLAFRPVDLEAAGGDRGDVDPAAVLADITVQHHRVAVGEAEPLGVGATASRTARLEGSTCSRTMLLNCLPRLVATLNVPSGWSRLGSGTTEKWALPSGVGNFQPAHRCGPPYWNWSPNSASRWMPS